MKNTRCKQCPHIHTNNLDDCSSKSISFARQASACCSPLSLSQDLIFFQNAVFECLNQSQFSKFWHAICKVSLMYTKNVGNRLETERKTKKPTSIPHLMKKERKKEHTWKAEQCRNWKQCIKNAPKKETTINSHNTKKIV